MVVRERRQDDLPGCTQLAHLVHEVDGYPPYLPGEISEFIQSPDAITAWVAEDDGDLVGHVALHSRSSRAVMDLAVAETRARSAASEPFGVISRLFVRPATRRTGVGGALLQTAVTHAVGLGLFPVLDVVTHLQPAIRFYEALGWTRAGKVTVPLPDGTSFDEIVYFAPSFTASP
ncbi:MAG: GNAT family N-acetyltransferase [Acidimicrobiales bacterium]